MTLRLAFLGCGKIVPKHVKTMRAIGADVSCAFASRSVDKAESYRQQLGGVAAYGSYEAAMAANDVDVVFVATPPHLHLELALAALEQGKHVIVEKPPFFRSGDFDTVGAVAARVGRQAFVAENYFYKPVAAMLRKLLAEGAIGDPIAVYLNAMKVQQPEDWRADPALTGGGALFEGGIHWVNLLNNLGLTPVQAGGFARQADPRRERTAVVSVKYAEGAVGTLLTSWESPSPLQGLRMSRVYGTAGAIFFESNGLILTVSGKRKTIKFPGVRDLAGYRAMFADFFAALTQNRPPQLTLAMAKRDVEVIEAAYAGTTKTIGSVATKTF